MHALILVDLQYDFMPGGALAVPDGDQVVAVANRLMPLFDFVVATKDWHPADHLSFASQHKDLAVGDVAMVDGIPQILWPDHCIQGSPGAKLHKKLDRHRIQHIVSKGMNARIDSYSGFFDNGRREATELESWLRRNGVNGVAVMGLATDYCVKFTALDAAQLGLKTTLVVDGCRGVNMHPGDVEQAVAEMQSAGVRTEIADTLVSYMRR